MTNVVKGAGRARHQANRKHQQRTPLPPKQPTMAGLESLLPGAAGPKKTSPSKRTAALKDAVEAQQAANKAAPRKRIAAKKATAKVGYCSECGCNAKLPCACAKDCEQHPEAKVDTKPERVSKAQTLALAAEAAGWKVNRVVEGTHKTLVATRGDERIEANWENDKSCHPLGYHTIAGHTEKFQHVTVAIKMINTAPEVAAAAVKPVKAARGSVEAGATRRVKVSVPFNPREASDEEVLDALLGHRVEWTNQYTEVLEAAVIPINGKTTKMLDDDINDLSTRQLTFCDADGGGYRTLRLRDLMRVSPRVVDDGHMLALAQAAASKAVAEGKGKR